ncbi:hypothetical protein VFPPC_08418 [Pochonia chlamydosporia 170]|uniref:Uncharacterized protein n=1 Tax=Pochonia chlamydosporia 170 TaxID=1380566 RepID=A0A179FMP9_METCM|nr:hypothetical protein VFPPC_08418 [Pochonia chlamydosporia 170]OAQ66925.1 hypothetical protein VFPPC_08418 [Pochonia chlamydosporia 170]
MTQDHSQSHFVPTSRFLACAKNEYVWKLIDFLETALQAEEGGAKTNGVMFMSTIIDTYSYTFLVHEVLFGVVKAVFIEVVCLMPIVP